MTLLWLAITLTKIKPQQCRFLRNSVVITYTDREILARKHGTGKHLLEEVALISLAQAT